jgi:hypothetical protein
MNHFAAHIGQPELNALVIVRQSLVINAQQMEERRMEIVHGRQIFRHAVTEWIGGAIREARPQAGAGQPTRDFSTR